MKDKTDDKTLTLPEVAEAPRPKGRPRQYATAAERQAAYRARQKTAGRRVVARYTLDVRDDAQPLASTVIDLSPVRGAKIERQPTADEQAGMDWWNGLTEVGRAYWLEQAGGAAAGASVAMAWAAWQRDQQRGR